MKDGVAGVCGFCAEVWRSFRGLPKARGFGAAAAGWRGKKHGKTSGGFIVFTQHSVFCPKITAKLDAAALIML